MNLNHYADGIEVPPCSTKQLRSLASNIRDLFNLSIDEPFPVAYFIEYALPLLYPDFVLEITSKNKMGDKHGETFPDKHLIRLREDVYEGICTHKGQDRFTGMHECAHQIYHEGVPLTLARRTAKNLPAYRNLEWQADTLAAELLMPYEIARYMNPGDIQRKFIVSKSAALTRFNKLKKEIGMT